MLNKCIACHLSLAASMVVATHLIADIAGKRKSFTETQFVKGYILASLGRGLLHGDMGSVGNEPVTNWKLKLMDFTALQQATADAGRIYFDAANFRKDIGFDLI